MWGYPYLTWLALAAMACILTAMAFIPEQRVSLLFGVVSVGVLLLAYAVRGRLRRIRGAAQVEQTVDREAR